MMKNRGGYFFIFTILFIFIGSSLVEASDYSIPPSIRFTLEREGSSSPLVYYFSKPENVMTYPILILCEGSSSKGSLGSVFYIRNYFLEKMEALGVGYLTVEKWGIDGNQINEKEFWSHYTRSQRLEDHLKVVQYLEENPPERWNGKIILVGVSEGGPLVTDLTITCPNTLATINWVGAGDWSWAEELWEFFENWKQNSFWMRLYDAIPRWIPFSSDIPKTRQEYDILVQHIIENPSSEESMGGMTYLYHADAFQKSSIDYSKIKTPFLIVKGTEESDILSCDQFFQKAREAEAPITYFRIDGMDHYIRKRPDVIDQSFEWLKTQLSLNEFQSK